MGALHHATINALLSLLLVATTTTANKVTYSVECSGQTMVVRVPVAGGVTAVELEKWGSLPGCGALRSPTHYTLTLPLDDDLSCGTTRVRNKLTGAMLYYHRVSVTSPAGKQMVLVKCRVAPDNSSFDNIVKRDVLPPEFVEPDYIEITSEVTGTAPDPILGVGVRQNGQLVGGQINVRPGTPLTMEVFLDDGSADIYGILMSFMEVTDTANKRETIIFNGCSLDPVLFDNFITTTGDYVSAKFRAFKFPETNYVLFRGTVDVCLDKCQGIACSNGQLGFGRRRRDINDQAADPNKIFEVTMMTFLKVEETQNSTKDAAMEEDVIKAAEELTNRVVDDVGAVELALKEVAQERAMEAAIVDRALQEEIKDDLPWDRPMEEEDRTSLYYSKGEGPVYIYYNSATKCNSLLVIMATAVVLVVLGWH